MPSLIVPETPQPAVTPKKKDKSKKKDKDGSEKKSSKKRQREEDDVVALEREESPSKRTRISLSPQTSPQVIASRSKPAQPAAIDWSLKAADHNEGRTPIYKEISCSYLPLSPVSLRHPLKGVCAEHLSSLILTYYPPLKGIVLSYRDVRLSSHRPRSANSQTVEEAPLAQQLDEYAPSFIWVTATFLVLRLQRGMYLDAVVNLQNESHLGLIVWNLFSASIPRERLPKNWRWRDVTPGTSTKGQSNEEDGWGGDEHGYFLDGEGKRLPRQVSFRVRDFEASPASEGDRGFVSIEGTLLGEEEDKKLDQEEGQKEVARRTRKDKERRREVMMAGALNGDTLVGAQREENERVVRNDGEGSEGGRHRTSY